MMIFWKASLALLSVPKTGTHAYMAALSDRADIVLRHPTGMKHMPARRFDRKFRPLLPQNGAGLETMAVIREPVDWLGSWYRYRSRPALAGHANSTAGLSFEDFVEGYLTEPRPAWAQVGSQFRFVSDEAEQPLVDHLFAYEEQDRILSFLSERLGFPVHIDRRSNVSPSGELTLSAGLQKRLDMALAADFAMYGRASG